LEDGHSRLAWIVGPAPMALAGRAAMTVRAAAIALLLPRRRPHRPIGPSWR
jgi:hypothetical protein